MKSPQDQAMVLVATEPRPFSKTPSGKMVEIKVRDWEDLSHAFSRDFRINVLGFNELGRKSPHIVEGFTDRARFLMESTFPNSTDHFYINNIRTYWPDVVKAGIPAIDVFDAGYFPEVFPVFVRGESGRIAFGGRIDSSQALESIRSSSLVIRPYMPLLGCGERLEMTLEARVHIVDKTIVCIEFAHPSWSDNKPSRNELRKGYEWLSARLSEITTCAQHLCKTIRSSWFVADFAETVKGLRLVELNPGWCAGLAHEKCARAVHLSILSSNFTSCVPKSLWPDASPHVPFIRNH